MGEYGSLFGWLIIIGLIMALLNFPVKIIYRKWVSVLDKDSKIKSVYSAVQKIIIKYHRFFAGFATLMLIAHLIIQLQYRWLSTTGLIAAIFLVINGFLGGYGYYIRKKKKSTWLYVHRLIAVLATLAIILHVVMRGR